MKRERRRFFESKRNRHYYFHSDVAAHVVDAGFLQAAQMVLIGAVEDIMGGKGYTEKLLAADVDVGSCGGIP